MLGEMENQGKNWESRIEAESEKRVALAKDPNYNGKRNPVHALAPVRW